MKKYLLLMGLLAAAILPLGAQQAVENDSLRRLLPRKIELNPDPLLSTNKPWLDFDLTLPTLPTAKETKKPLKLTLHPWTINTPYDWDPFLQKKIPIGQDRTARLKNLTRPYTNAKPRPAPANEGPVALPDLPGSVNGVGGTVFSGDLLKYFSKDFWNFRGRKNRARAKAVLDAYEPDTVPSVP
jgi:hypothetical protein